MTYTKENSIGLIVQFLNRYTMLQSDKYQDNFAWKRIDTGNIIESLTYTWKIALQKLNSGEWKPLNKIEENYEIY